MTSEETTRAARGVVKWFDPAKGFGFVVAEEGGVDILLHANVLRNFGQNSVADGASIEIVTQVTDRGCQAIEVISIEHRKMMQDPRFLIWKISILSSLQMSSYSQRASNGSIRAKDLALPMSLAQTPTFLCT